MPVPPHRRTLGRAGRLRAAVGASLFVSLVVPVAGSVQTSSASAATRRLSVTARTGATTRTARVRPATVTTAPRTSPGVTVTPGTAPAADPILNPAPAVVSEGAPATTAPPPTTLPPAPSSSASADALAMLAMVNGERAANGLPALAWDDPLGQLGLEWSQNMSVNGFRHRDLSTLRQPAGVRTGENIAWGQGQGQTVAALHTMLMNSPGHRANLLSPNYHRIGIGVYRVGDALWITQEFAS